MIVMTKTRFLLFFKLARTSVMPFASAELGRLGVRFRWATTDPVRVERLHGCVVETLGDGITLSDLRWIANAGKEFLSLGLPFVPEDAPLPESLKLISKDIKSVL